MIKLTMCVFDRNYDLITLVPFAVSGHTMPPESVMSVLLAQMATERIDGALYPEVHVGCAVGHVTREGAMQHAEELRRREPFDTITCLQHQSRF